MMSRSLKYAYPPKRSSGRGERSYGNERKSSYARKPFFGALQPVAVPGLLLLLGIAAIATFYGSMLMAAHAVAGSGSKDQAGRITFWVCMVLLAQGLFPLLRFGLRDLPKLIAGSLRDNARDMALFVVLLVAAAFLFL
jgi:hypothetical protein